MQCLFKPMAISKPPLQSRYTPRAGMSRSRLTESRLSSRGSVLEGLLALTIFGLIVAAMLWALFTLKARWLAIGTTGLGFSGAVFLLWTVLLVALPFSRTRYMSSDKLSGLERNLVFLV